MSLLHFERWDWGPNESAEKLHGGSRPVGQEKLLYYTFSPHEISASTASKTFRSSAFFPLTYVTFPLTYVTRSSADRHAGRRRKASEHHHPVHDYNVFTEQGQRAGGTGHHITLSTANRKVKLVKQVAKKSNL